MQLAGDLKAMLAMRPRKAPRRDEYDRLPNSQPPDANDDFVDSEHAEYEVRIRQGVTAEAQVIRQATERIEQCEMVCLSAMGNAISTAVKVAETLKRRIKGLHQIAEIGTRELVTVYEPLQSDKDGLEVDRRTSTMRILLSLAPLDTSHVGYQAPLAEWLVTDEGQAAGQRRRRGNDSDSWEDMSNQGEQQEADGRRNQRGRNRNRPRNRNNNNNQNRNRSPPPARRGGERRRQRVEDSPPNTRYDDSRNDDQPQSSSDRRRWATNRRNNRRF